MKYYFSSNYYCFIKDTEKSNRLNESNFVILPGGMDISPELYNSKNVACHTFNQSLDFRQWTLLGEAHHEDKFIIGICRGAQMITAYNGGKLIQDVTGHFGDHSITFQDGRVCQVTSCHHQMCYPFNLPKEDYNILAWSTDNLSDHYYSDGLENPPCEPEVIWYPKTKMLAIQGHPEWMNSNNMFIEIINEIIERYAN